jgi:peptide/nickel transport system permease protein
MPTDVARRALRHGEVSRVSFAGYVTRRTLFAVLTVYLVVSLTFGVVALTPNTHLGGELSAASYYDRASEEEIAEMRDAYLEARDLDRPLTERYAEWLVDVTTLDWGFSYGYERPVAAVLGDAIPRTALYVLPALALALLFGTLFGVLSAEFGGLPDRVVRLTAYAVVGVPVFVTAFLAPAFVGDYAWLQPLSWVTAPFVVEGQPANPNLGLWPPSKPLRFLLPAALFALSLVGWQLRYVRTAYLDHAAARSTKLHEAKGAGRLRVARHVLRNAAVRVVSASLSELLVVALLGIYVVEGVFGIQGVAAVNMAAVRTRDMPLILGSSLVLAFGGILASFAQDVLYGYLDPRVSAE